MAKATKERRAQLQAEREENWRTCLLNHLFKYREAVQQYDVKQKKAVVIEFTRYGCKPEDIHAASGLAKDFVYSTVKQFAHQCLTEKVRINAERSEG